MRFFKGLVLWSAIAIGVVVGSDDGETVNDVDSSKEPVVAEDNGVAVLTGENFVHFVNSNKLVMVEFYLPDCVHCQRLAPEYAKAATKLKEHGVRLAKLDATKAAPLAGKYLVQSYPTLIVFKDGDDGKPEEYVGERTADDIFSYMMVLNDPDWVPPPSAVVDLTAVNFDEVVEKERLSLVMFYAPWCKHCKDAKPELEAAAVDLKTWGISLFKVDGTKEKELAEQYSVSGWPTFKLFRRGRVYDYGGPRDRAGIVTNMKSQAKPPSEEKAHTLGIKNNMDGLEITVVGFFNGKSDLYDEYVAAANELRGSFKFLHTFSRETADTFEVPRESVTVFMPETFSSAYENKTYSLTKKSATYKEIVSFVKKHSVPLVGQRTKRNAFKYAERPLIVVYYDVNFDSHSVADSQYIRSKVLEVAKNFVGSSLKFAISSEEEFADEMKSLGFEDSREDVSVGCFTEKQKFRMRPTEEFETEDLASFVEDLKNGKAAPYMKSQPVPESQEGPVKTIVADNYDAEIHKVKKDAVLFIHAPWCSHCKEFDPIFKKVAKKMLKSNENIVFGKIDGTSNDIPYMFPPVKGFPAIFFVPANEKYDPIQFKGDRNSKSVKEWIKQHSSVFVTGEAAELEEEIESFTLENFEEIVNKVEDENVAADGEKKRDEL